MMDGIDWGNFCTAVAAGAVLRATPIAYAAMGESIAEKSGVLNLGVEGMMLVGAMSAFVVEVKTGNPILAIGAAGLAATALAALHACLVLLANANQVVSGFAVTMLGTGLSAFYGRPYVGKRIDGLTFWRIAGLSDVPVLGEVLFRHDILIYASILISAVVWFGMYRTRFGLQVRAVGEDPQAAYAQGVNVVRIRFMAVLLGGFLAGVGGAHLSIAYTHVWANSMTAGQGWIAIGLVIVARWHPVGCLFIAWVFGAMMVLHPHLQASGVKVSSYLIAMLPFLFAIVALVVVTTFYRRAGYGMPAALAQQLTLPNKFHSVTSDVSN